VEKVVGIKSKQNFKYTSEYDKAFSQFGQEEPAQEKVQEQV